MNTVSPLRRGFLRGSLRSGPTPLRPPWARPEESFITQCTRCDECARVCPTRIVMRGSGGFPELDFSAGECTFCRACLEACEPAALLETEGLRALPLQARIGDDCLARRQVECRICGEACPSSAIRFRPRLGGVALPALNEAGCTGCGACVAPCPTRAISLERLP